MSARTMPFSRLIESIRSKNAFLWPSNNVLKLVQALALILGGCWVVFMYLSFQKASNQSTLEQQRLAVEQARITLKTQEQSDAVALERNKLSIQQAEISLKTQEESEQRALEQQKLSVAQAEVTLQIQKSQKELQQQDLELNKLKQKQTEHQVAYDTTYRADTNTEVTVHRVRDEGNDWATYRVTLYVTVTNKSSTPFEISVVGLDYYTGELPVYPAAEARRRVFSRIGQPESWWYSGRLQGVVAWQRVGSDGSITLAALGKIKSPWNYVERTYQLEIAGSGTGIWKPDEVAQIYRTFLVRAHKDTYVGFGINLCFNRAEKPDADLYHFFTYTQLSDPEHEKDAEDKAETSG